MKNFIEVGKTDEEKAEQIKQWLKENGLQIIIGIAFGLSAIWGWDYYKNYEYQQSIQARTQYLSLASNNNEQAFDALQNNHASSGYVQQATLLMAKRAVEAKDYPAALDYLLPLADAENVFIARIAKLRAASVYLEMGKYAQALTLLDSNADEAFSGLYSQLKGDVYFAQNQLDSAKEYYQLALSQLSPNSGVRQLVQTKLNDLN